MDTAVLRTLEIFTLVHIPEYQMGKFRSSFQQLYYNIMALQVLNLWIIIIFQQNKTFQCVHRRFIVSLFVIDIQISTMLL